MTLDEFFKLPWAEQEEAARLVHKRRMISSEAQSIKAARAQQDELERELQQKCTHPAKQRTHHRNEHYDSHTTYYTDFYCPDCDKRWRLEGSQ